MRQDQDDWENTQIEDPEDKFHTFLTEDDDYQFDLPKFIKLDDPFPKENPMMQKRSRPVAIRFHKANVNNNPHKFMLSELMLYIPFRDEETDFKPYDTDALENIYFENEKKLKSIKGKVMEYLESVEEARYFVEEALDKINLEEVGADLDAAKEQEQAECEELMTELHPEYAHIHTDNVDNDVPPAERETHLYSKIDIPELSVLKAKTRKLDPHQREVLNIAGIHGNALVRR